MEIEEENTHNNISSAENSIHKIKRLHQDQIEQHTNNVAANSGITSTQSTSSSNDNGLIFNVIDKIKREVSVVFSPTYPYDKTDMLTMKRKSEHVAEKKDEKYKPDEMDSNICIKKFYDYRPLENKKYFKTFTKTFDKNGIKRTGLSVVIPFFNEPSHELQQTLNSLYNAYLELQLSSKRWREKQIRICLIQDGWHKAHFTMQNYLKKLFPRKINGVDWWDHFPEFNKNFSDTETNAMYIFEKGFYEPTEINVQDGFEKDRKPMILTLVVKINNRRKHNSHEWFLGKNGYAEASNGEYLFLTDAFTLYSETCLFHLVKELDNNKSLGAVTGRQRLMTRDQQGSDTETVLSLGFLLRMVQLGDFELANCVYNGAFHNGGLLPVIPGPCGLYRASVVLENNVRDSYFKVVNEEPDKTGLVLGNLRIAEDRVLSFYSVTKVKERYMAFNPLAVFYFEAETDLQKFMLQRRRWINGSVAGYLYLLIFRFFDYLKWETSHLRKLYVGILLFCQLFTYAMVGIAPGISLKIFYYGIDYFNNYYNWGLDLELIALFVIIWAIYIAHVIVHNIKKFNFALIYILLALAICTSVVTFSSLFHFIFISTQKNTSEFALVYDIVLCMGVCVFVGPFFLALLLSGRGHSLLFMIKSYPAYILFMPMMIAWFGSYSYSRTWDLTWGNRPATELNDMSKDKKQIMIAKFKEKSVKIILVLLACNLGIFFAPLIAQVAVVGLFFAVALYQMSLSFIFCLTKIYYKIKVTIGKICRFIKGGPNPDECSPHNSRIMDSRIAEV
ncbi:MAG: hypothetical protein Satyrvirus34_8 [Satyrvirus sp.]|uniref:chitin synthase n=1 Tax=Satyrvirus sp. TaxID=2487771 RepID=A0A3G5AF16_9VIRU|nr:MAG: hypothetical protein Satyrvirus34_8 [Satyrvirus sp.]